MTTEQFFAWESLSAMGGAALLTFFIVQYTKQWLDRMYKLPTDLYAVFLAFLVLLAAKLALGASGADWRLYVLTFANSFFVAAAAGQMQQKSIMPSGTKEDASQ